MNSEYINLGELVAKCVEKQIARPSKDSAKAFMVALLACGKRPNDHGVMVSTRDVSIIRADECAAIEAFCGYNAGGSHGSQLDAARDLAKRLLSASTPDPKATPFHRGASATLAGYVAGMPDNVAHQQGVLEGLIREKAEAWHEAIVNHAAPEQIARIERELSALRARR